MTSPYLSSYSMYIQEISLVGCCTISGSQCVMIWILDFILCKNVNSNSENNYLLNNYLLNNYLLTYPALLRFIYYEESIRHYGFICKCVVKELLVLSYELCDLPTIF